MLYNDKNKNEYILSENKKGKRTPIVYKKIDISDDEKKDYQNGSYKWSSIHPHNPIRTTKVYYEIKRYLDKANEIEMLWVIKKSGTLAIGRKKEFEDIYKRLY